MSGDAFNPYAAPAHDPGGPVPSGVGEATPEEEAIRRSHMHIEASARTLSWLNFIFGGFMLLGGGGLILFTLSGEPSMSDREKVAVPLLGLLYGLVGAGSIATGRGVRGLREWAWWLWVVPMVIALSFGVLAPAVLVIQEQPFGLIAGVMAAYIVIPGVVLRALLSSSGRLVFTPYYRDIVARTPHVRTPRVRTSRRTLLPIVLAVVILVIAAAVLSVS